MAKFKYDCGYGSAYVARDLIILFKDGTRLERSEYDGSEWWRAVKPLVRRLESVKKIRHLRNGSDDWEADTLADMNGTGD